MERLIELIEPNFIYEDQRGSLTQLVREGYSQVNVITSKEGCIRGGHYHKQNRETFYVVSGALRLTVKKDGQSEVYTFRKGAMFTISPFVCHDFVFLSDTLLVSMYDRGVELSNGEKDIFVDNSKKK